MNLFDGVNASVEALFSIPDIALWLASGLLAWCAAIILVNRHRHYAPLARRLDERLAATEFVEEAGSDADARIALADAFAEVDAAMMAAGDGADGLTHAWSRFRGGLLDPGETPLRATVDADDAFAGIGRETRALGWWANIFVAVGLSFTFLGIVAALLKAVQAMGAGADPATMQVALVGLLRITAAKFWTSIGGVVSSIVLRVFDRRWTRAIDARLDRLCARLERATVFTTPQQLAHAQLRLAEEAGGGARVGHEIVGVVGTLVARIQSLEGGRGERDMATAARALREAAAALAEAATAAGRSQATAAQATTNGAATLGEAAGEVGAVIATLGKVAPQMVALAAPLGDGVERLGRAAEAIEEAVRLLDRRAARADDTAGALATSLGEASAAAARAFESYRERFDAVDVSLGHALDAIGAASADHAAALTAQVGQIDAALGAAVDRLAGALGVVGDLAAALDDMRGEMRRAR